jgi:hypothetical protein
MVRQRPTRRPAGRRRGRTRFLGQTSADILYLTPTPRFSSPFSPVASPGHFGPTPPDYAMKYHYHAQAVYNLPGHPHRPYYMGCQGGW